MARKDFIPRSPTDFKEWGDNFISGLHNNNNLVTTAKVQEAGTACQNINLAYDELQSKENAYKRALANYNQSKENNLPILRNIVNDVKKSDNYNDGIAQSLKIVTVAPQPTDWDAVKPNPKIKILANCVEISYTRADSEGVRVFCKRGNDTDFKFIAHNTGSPFEDTRANMNGNASEKREYYLVYVRKNRPVGQLSDIVTANVSLQNRD